MITAKKFIQQNAPCSLEGFMIEFAKLHVEAAKKEYYKVLMKQSCVTEAEIEYFNNVYPLENIK